MVGTKEDIIFVILHKRCIKRKPSDFEFCIERGWVYQKLLIALYILIMLSVILAINLYSFLVLQIFGAIFPSFY